ncbi:type II toxin-antitoxin system MqsA family antitoxin [Faecalibacterium prausnitzii]|jgi:YgiT-type zinc finger domain-containing protein|uniref:type II toxin-antitoxin system MqsA family antitoxin n=1 Tax=Faecalibacterium prausnitzii TaxID=853 RepID=UPI0022E16264|nr:type II toxin-antitoxin system MqsA family antitoxin [Faecalibacterium prausnitzii]
MTCLLCKGEMKLGTTIHTVQLKNCVVVIKNVPCMKCEQCGEDVLSADTVARIERILHTVKKAVAEITVVNFPDCAA